jgi:hypothetical protein
MSSMSVVNLTIVTNDIVASGSYDLVLIVTMDMTCGKYNGDTIWTM